VVISILMRNIERKSRLSHCCLWWQLNNVLIVHLRFEVNRHRTSYIYVQVLWRSLLMRPCPAHRLASVTLLDIDLCCIQCWSSNIGVFSLRSPSNYIPDFLVS
jgi:hypothetical protein